MPRAGDRPEPPRAVALPSLTPFAGDALGPHGDYDAVHVTGDFTRQAADDARFLGCRLERCGLDEVSMRRARISECLLEEIHATSLDVADSVWRDSLLTVRRIGASWSSVRVRGGRLDLLDLSGAKLSVVAFEGCSIGELDLGTSEARDLTCADSRIEVLDVTGARLTRVDLTGAEIGAVRGVAGLRGATITPAQLLSLSPEMAAHLGIRVRA